MRRNGFLKKIHGNCFGLFLYKVRYNIHTCVEDGDITLDSDRSDCGIQSRFNPYLKREELYDDDLKVFMYDGCPVLGYLSYDDEFAIYYKCYMDMLDYIDRNKWRVV